MVKVSDKITGKKAIRSSTFFSCLLTIQKQTHRNSETWKGLGAASSQIFAEVELSPIENDTEEKQNSKKKQTSWNSSKF